MALTPDINILNFKNSYTIYEKKMKVICTISDGEFNMSQNPTIQPIQSGSLRFCYRFYFSSLCYSMGYIMKLMNYY